MPSIQIKDVPEETHAVLRRRAAAARQSLQEYLLGHLIESAGRPTVDEVLGRVRHRTGTTITGEEIAAIVRDDRDRR